MADPKPAPPIKGGGKIVVLVSGRVSVTSANPGVVIQRIG
jgi:hypothetical protein